MDHAVKHKQMENNIKIRSVVSADADQLIKLYEEVWSNVPYNKKAKTYFVLNESDGCNFCKEGFEIVQQITKPEKQVAIMLDDGFRGIYEVRDFFYENNIFPTIFLPAGHIGKKCLLSKNEILDLQSHGFRFECHSWSHSDLTLFSDEELKHELGDSKIFLNNLLGKNVNEICLPIGYFSDHLLQQLKLFGYKEVYSSIPGNLYGSRIWLAKIP